MKNYWLDKKLQVSHITGLNNNQLCYISSFGCSFTIDDRQNPSYSEFTIIGTEYQNKDKNNIVFVSPLNDSYAPHFRELRPSDLPTEINIAGECSASVISDPLFVIASGYLGDNNVSN